MDNVKKTSDKVIILGTTPSWKKAPLSDRSWEVWGLGPSWETWGKYATRWFEIHPVSLMRKLGWRDYKWLTKCPIPVYMIKHYADIPNSVPYPLAEVSKGFIKQFSSTFCYELALAIHENFKTIGIYGVDFRYGTLRERFVELRGVLYWLGVAAGRGIKIQFPDAKNEEFVHRYLYGLQCWEEADYVRSEIRQAFVASAYSIVDGLGLNYYNFKKKHKIN
jgi:hypothetical protein